jgi:hypothetical protein
MTSGPSGTAAPSGVLVGVTPVSAVAGQHSDAKTTAAEHFELIHVLVVDDDEAVRKACCQIASGMGFAVMGADSATSAREVLQHQRICCCWI